MDTQRFKICTAALAAAFIGLVSLTSCAPSGAAPGGGVAVDVGGVRTSAEAGRETAEPADMTPEEQSLTVIADSNGRHIEMSAQTPGGGSLRIDAAVEADGVTRVGCYDYLLVPVDDALRRSLLEARFGERASDFVYDAQGVWTLTGSAEAGDYYLYTAFYPAAGETIKGEQGFLLEYRNVDLYPFEDNLLETPENPNMTLSPDEAASLCDELVESAVGPQGDYAVDCVHAYGTQGRRPYYRFVYKKVLDGMTVTAYNDIILLADSDGVQKVYGAVYDVREAELRQPILSAETAAAILCNDVERLGIEGGETLSVGRITPEYLVTKDAAGSASVVPVWRFWIGGTQDLMNLNRDRILAVDAVAGEVIQEERGNTF